ncbi:MAG: hypothetical protein WB795_06000, partial [Candidatus Acidiferrales bacterium]
VNMNARAPLQPGTYHILFAFQLELGGGNVASGTNWSTRGDVWNGGNDLAEFNDSQIKSAQNWGCAVDSWLMPEGPQLFYVPADAITVQVGAAQTTRRAAGTEPTGPAAITRRVPAAQPWTATGIHLSSGQRVTISGDGSIITNLNGAASTPSGTNPDCRVAGPVRIPFVVPELPCWSLIGRVGRSGEPFEVGAKIIFTAGAAGELYLGVNDNFFGDNSGAWSATITTGPPSVTSAAKPATQPPVTSETECLGSDRAGIRNNTHGTVRIVQGTGAFESVTPGNKILAVSPGEVLQGTVTLTALNNGPGFAVAVMVETPSWGDHAHLVAATRQSPDGRSHAGRQDKCPSASPTRDLSRSVRIST